MKASDVELVKAGGGITVALHKPTSSSRVLHRRSSGGAEDYMVCESSDGSAMIISVSGICAAIKGSDLFKAPSEDVVRDNTAGKAFSSAVASHEEPRGNS